MTIPNYQEFMNPALRSIAEVKKEIKPRDVENRAADLLKLSDEDRLQFVPSGAETVLRNRVNWACCYMLKAGLLERPKRGFYKLSKEGLSVLESGKKINNEFLMKYPSFVAFVAPKKNAVEGEFQKILVEADDPETRISNALGEITEIVKQDLLEILKKVEPEKFEHIVVDLMEAMNYGVGQTTRYVRDGGIDGIVDEDELGLSRIYLQAKRYAKQEVGEVEMRDFIGALAASPVKKGVFVTTNFFSKTARNSAEKSSNNNLTIRLVDGKELVKLMFKYNLGVRVKKGYEVKEIDNSFFEE